MQHGSSRIYVFRSPDGGSFSGGGYGKLIKIIGIIAALYLISYLLQGPRQLLADILEHLILIPVILISLSTHEYAHARVADFLGDPTPRREGRLSLNPMRHLDLVGTLMLFFARFGWAKPVRVDPSNFRIPHRAMMAVALAGPLTNIALALLSGLALRITLQFSNQINHSILFGILKASLLMVMINLGLALFNMIPLPPLDGSRVINYFLPARYRQTWREIEAMGPLILLLMFVFGIISRILSPGVFYGLDLILWLYEIPREVLFVLMR